MAVNEELKYCSDINDGNVFWVIQTFVFLTEECCRENLFLFLFFIFLQVLYFSAFNLLLILRIAVARAPEG